VLTSIPRGGGEFLSGCHIKTATGGKGKLWGLLFRLAVSTSMSASGTKRTFYFDQ